MGDYSHYRKITIDNTKVAETDANFAVLLNLTAVGSGVLSNLATVGNGGDIENTANGGASGAYTVPADLTFRTSADLSEAGANLDFEITYYDAATGALIVWVQSGVNSGADIDIYMIYGNADVATSQEDVSGTWDSNFKGVYHFSDASGGLVDSTLNGKDLTEHGAPTYRQSGKVGYSISFDGSDDYFRLDSFIDISTLSAIMISGWIKPTSGTVPAGCEIGTRNSGRVCVRPNTNDLDTILATPDEPEYCINYPANNIVDAWTHFAATYAGPGTVSGTYKVNNSDEGAFTTVGTPTFAELTGAAADRLTIAAGATLTTDDIVNAFMTGEFCEVRISNIARSADWISTVYANQNAPNTFYSVGAEQSAPHQQAVAGALTSSGVVRGKALKRIAGVITYVGTLSLFAELFYQAVAGVFTFIGAVISRVLRGADADYEYRIDTSTEDMDNVEALLGIAPAGVRFRYHPIIQQSGIGVSGGSGYSQCEWVFDYLSWASLALMLAFLGGDESVGLYINTRRPDNTFGLYSATMHRPHVPGEATQIIGGWRNVTFRFTHLESV